MIDRSDLDALVGAAGVALRGLFPRSSLLDRGGAVTDSEWGKLAAAGWIGAGADPAVGGAALPVPGQALLFLEAGRHLVPGPLLGSVLAAHVLSEGGAAELATEVVDGRARASLLVPRRSRDGSQWLVDADGPELVVAISLAGAAVHARSQVVGERVAALDPRTTLERITAIGPPIVVLPPAAARRVWLRGVVVVAALQAGIAAACLDLAVDQAQRRVQFGAPIGTFQAVKHRCADMAIRAEAARALLLEAAEAVHADNSDADLLASAAKVVADRAAIANAGDCIHLHGAMGFTWELGLHLFVTRAQLHRELVIDPAGALTAVLTAGRERRDGAFSLTGHQAGGPTRQPRA